MLFSLGQNVPSSETAQHPGGRSEMNNVRAANPVTQEPPGVEASGYPLGVIPRHLGVVYGTSAPAQCSHPQCRRRSDHGNDTVIGACHSLWTIPHHRPIRYNWPMRRTTTARRHLRLYSLVARCAKWLIDHPAMTARHFSPTSPDPAPSVTAAIGTARTHRPRLPRSCMRGTTCRC